MQSIELEDISINTSTIKLDDLEIGRKYIPKLSETLTITATSEIQTFTPSDSNHEITEVVCNPAPATNQALIDFVNITGGKYMFNNIDVSDAQLATLDFNNVVFTNCRYMFSACYHITTIPLLDTSNVTDMGFMFGQCENLINVPLFNTSNVTTMENMFYICYLITDIPSFDTSKVTNMSSMFYESRSITTIPLFNTSNVTNASHMFHGCSNLAIVPALDFSKVTTISYIFYLCSSLTEIHIHGISVTFDIHFSTLFTESALVEILNNLAVITSTQTLYLGSTNLAKLTSEEIAIATGKGWTLA